MKHKSVEKRAKKRIEYLFDLAKQDSKLSKTAISHMRRIAQKHNIKITEYKRRICLKCNNILKGRTRIKQGRRVITCSNCGHVKRL